MALLMTEWMDVHFSFFVGIRFSNCVANNTRSINPESLSMFCFEISKTRS